MQTPSIHLTSGIARELKRPSGAPAAIGYWVATGIIAFVLLSGGAAYLARPPAVVEGIVRLGYPLYLLVILGVWKVLGGLTLLAPRLPTLKEWAYAGVIFDFTGAAASHWFARDFGPYAFHVAVPLALVFIAAASWAWRPHSRRYACGTM